MTPQPSQTRMCNEALAHLGETHRITSIDDGTPLAKMFEAVWDSARDEVLADHPWNFAVFRRSIPVSADYVPEGGQYTQAFELPGDCLRWLPPKTNSADQFEGEQEGNYLLSNADAPITVRYIRRIEEPVKWSPGFRAALSAKLARKLAKPVTGQSAMQDRMEALYNSELRDAKRQDGHATGDRQRSFGARSDWLAARNQRWSGS